MSCLSENSEVSDFKPAKSPEQSSFSQTCSLLSQYLKEKGNFGDLSVGMTCSIDGCGSPATSCHSTTITNLLPTKSFVDSSVIKSVSKEPKAAQLTIFYAGQVIVFDDFPAEKAKEIMFLASNGISQTQNGSAYTYTQNQPSFPPDLVSGSADSKVVSNFVQEHSRSQPRPVIADLPIARKASLHRFLVKRKDRIAARAPYQTSNLKKSAEAVPWIGLSLNSPQV